MDLVDKTKHMDKSENIRQNSSFTDVPIIFTSVINKQRIFDFETAPKSIKTEFRVLLRNLTILCYRLLKKILHQLIKIR